MMRGQSRQKGYTLLELIIALGLVGVMLPAVVGLIWQEVRGSGIAKNTVTASFEMGNVSRRLSQDCMMAQSSDLVNEAAPVDNLTLSWVEWYNLTATPHVSTYWLAGSDLKRDYDGVVTTVARNISSIAFSQVDRVITVRVTSTPPWFPAKTMEQTFRVQLRPKE